MSLRHCQKLSNLLQTGRAQGRSWRLAVRCQSTAPATDPHASSNRKKIVFLGTPEVAAGVLRTLYEASQMSDSGFEISAVVTQPPRPKGRGSKTVATPSPVHAAAMNLGVPNESILTPVKAREADFLQALRDLSPDLCITAAYGNMLPQAFLDIPPLGTLNIHPSLLPHYRGAAPVPRALQDGVKETGVSVAYTVLRCDAGPVLAQQRVLVEEAEQAPELLDRLFALGTQLLLQHLPDVWAGRGPAMAVAQDEGSVSHAAKLSKEESPLDFSLPASRLHDQIRAFAPWPSTTATFSVQDPSSDKSDSVELKVLRSRVAPAEKLQGVAPGEVGWSDAGMLVPCGGGSVLEVLEVQPPMRKAVKAREYKNGLGKKRLVVPQCSPAEAAV